MDTFCATSVTAIALSITGDQDRMDERTPFGLLTGPNQCALCCPALMATVCRAALNVAVTLATLLTSSSSHRITGSGYHATKDVSSYHLSWKTKSVCATGGIQSHSYLLSKWHSSHLPHSKCTMGDFITQSPMRTLLSQQRGWLTGQGKVN